MPLGSKPKDLEYFTRIPEAISIHSWHEELRAFACCKGASKSDAMRKAVAF